MDRDYDIQDAFGAPLSRTFKVVLDATFHEFFGAPSAPFIGYRGYEKDSSQYVKIMPIKHRQARKGILYKFHFLTLAPLGGGAKGPPLWFFANSSGSTGNFDLKLAIPLWATIPHLVSKN